MAAEASAIFRAMDKNKDGALSQEEISMRLSDFGVPDSAIATFIVMGDKNEDGIFSEAEFKQAFTEYQSLLAECPPAPILMRRAYPQNPDVPVCSIFKNRGICPTFEESGICMMHHPLELGTKGGNFCVGLRQLSVSYLLESQVCNEIQITASREEGAIVEVYASESVLPQFRHLLSAEILSAPIWDSKASRYTGVLEVRDLVTYVLMLKKGSPSHHHTLRLDDLQGHVESAPSGTSLSQDGELEGAVQDGRLIHLRSDGKGGTTMTWWKAQEFIPVRGNTSLLEVVHILAEGTRRVMLLDSDGRVSGVISQSVVARFIATWCVDDDHTPTLAELGQVGTTKVISVHKDASAVKAFQLIDEHKVSGIAIEDSQGVLVDSTSGKDLALLFRDHSLRLLDQGILTFLEHYSQAQQTQSCQNADHPTLALWLHIAYAHSALIH